MLGVVSPGFLEADPGLEPGGATVVAAVSCFRLADPGLEPALAKVGPLAIVS